MSITNDLYLLKKETIEQKILIERLQLELDRIRKKKEDELQALLDKEAELKERFRTSTQTLYCDWNDYSAFTVPAGVDLKDTKNVKWYVRWNTLYIETRDGKKYELEATDSPQLKKPEACRVCDKDGNEESVEFNDQFEEEYTELDSLKEAIWDHTDPEICGKGMVAIRKNEDGDWGEATLTVYLRQLLNR